MANLACATVKTLLAANWTKNNTDGRVPKMANAEDETDPENALRPDTSYDYIKIYEPVPETRILNGIGTARILRTNHVSIDINVWSTMKHAYRVKEEVLRIIESTATAPGSGYQYTDLNQTEVQPFSGTRLQKMWRWVITIVLVKTNTTAGG